MKFETIIYFCSSTFHYFLAHVLKAKGTGKELTLSTKIETDKSIVVQCVELQKYKFAISAVLGVPAKNQVLTSPLTFHVPLFNNE